jgi:hypothetical protein
VPGPRKGEDRNQGQNEAEEAKTKAGPGRNGKAPGTSEGQCQDKRPRVQKDLKAKWNCKTCWNTDTADYEKTTHTQTQHKDK